MGTDDGHGKLTVPAFRSALAGGLLAAMMLSALWGCATVPPPSGTPGVRIEGVPFFPQDEYQCGPASLAAVMNYWGIAVAPPEISREIFSRTARGTLTIDMVLFAEKKGLTARQYRGNWDDLKKKVADGHPLIVLVDGGFSLYQANHYVVVTGFDDGTVIVNSGDADRGRVETGVFLRQWERAGFWTLWLSPEKR